MSTEPNDTPIPAPEARPETVVDDLAPGMLSWAEHMGRGHARIRPEEPQPPRADTVAPKPAGAPIVLEVEKADPNLAYTPIPVAWACLQTITHELTPGMRVWEPHAGAGAFLEALALLDTGLVLYGSDIDPDAPALARRDGAWWSRRWDALGGSPVGRVDWVLGNPPYGSLDGQIQRSLAAAQVGVAFLLIGQALAPASRDWMWNEERPDEVYWLRERVAFGGPGRNGKSTDMREYAWVIWRRQPDGGWRGRGELQRLSWRTPRVWRGGAGPIDLRPLPGPLDGAA